MIIYNEHKDYFRLSCCSYAVFFPAFAKTGKQSLLQFPASPYAYVTDNFRAQGKNQIFDKRCCNRFYCICHYPAAILFCLWRESQYYFILLCDLSTSRRFFSRGILFQRISSGFNRQEPQGHPHSLPALLSCASSKGHLSWRMDVSSKFFSIIGNGLALYENQQYITRDNISFVGESGVSKLTGYKDSRVQGFKCSMIVFALESLIHRPLETYFLYLRKTAITSKGIKRTNISAVAV